MQPEVHRSTDVFTPTKPARLTFVERDELNSQIVDSLRTPGKQILVYGPSGSGKTTFLVNKLHQMYEDHVTVRCTKDTTFPQILARAFDKLGTFYASEVSRKRFRSRKMSIAAEYLKIKAAIEASAGSERQESYVRAVALQITAERLAEFLGHAKSCLVLEDFHKVEDQEKVRIAQTMKTFMDMADDFPDVRMILIGAVDTAREVVRYDSDMQNRVSEVAVRLMSDQQVLKIMRKGEHLLNIRFPGTLKTEIARYAGGVAAVAHQLSLNLCFAADLLETAPTTLDFDPWQLDRALERYVDDSSDVLKEAFDLALRRQRIRKYDNARIILRALAKAGPNGATHNELLTEIRDEVPEYPAGNLTTYLRKLQAAENGGLLRHDSDSNRHFFANPIYLTYSLMVLKPGDSRLMVKTLNAEAPKIGGVVSVSRDINSIGLEVGSKVAGRLDPSPEDETPSSSPDETFREVFTGDDGPRIRK